MAKKFVQVSGDPPASSSGISNDSGGGGNSPTTPTLMLPLQTHLSIPLPLLRTTPTREETEEEGRVLLTTFVDHQVEQEHMEPREPMGDLVYSHILDEEDGITAQHTRAESLLAHPVYRRVGQELRDLADRFSQTEERRRVREEANSLDLGSLSRENLESLMHALFEGGFSRERLVTFFFFCSDLILKALRASAGALHWQVVFWIWAFFRDNVCGWVLQRGGWEAVLSSYLPKLAVTAAGVAVCAAAVFYIWRNW